MDIHAVLKEVTRWCERRTLDGDADAVEVDCHATVWITIGESTPPWYVRHERGSSAGASAPVAQLRYDVERREWALHHGGQAECKRWCGGDDAVYAREVSPLLDEIADDRADRFRGLPPGFRWPDPT